MIIYPEVVTRLTPRANEFFWMLRLLGRFWVWLYVLISVEPVIKASIFKVNWKANHSFNSS